MRTRREIRRRAGLFRPASSRVQKDPAYWNKRRLTVPAALAPSSPGDYFDARFDADEDTLVFRRLAGKDWLAVAKVHSDAPGSDALQV